ncbi:MAG: hypothetical protein M0001_05510 [Treponema sp.]|nr:hypothetical protein [Treponema sp.]
MMENMDSEKAHTALVSAIQTAMADMVFIDTEKTDRPITLEAENRAAIDILKPISLRLEVSAGPRLRGRIADILYGEDSEWNRDDAFLELLNVSAGIFLSEYYGAGMEVRLELPRYLFMRDDEEGAAVAEAGFDAEGEPLVAALRSIRYLY